MNKTLIVYAGDLWSVPRQGGVAQRLTTGQGAEANAVFSPDGNTLAFSGEYDGNVDVFTVPVAGGIPKRVTYHPAADRVVGWTPDGSHILLRSNRAAYARYTPVVHGLARRRHARSVAAAHGLQRRLFAGWQTHGV
jgi:tricorn protease